MVLRSTSHCGCDCGRVSAMVDSEQWDVLQMVDQRPHRVVAVYKRQEKSSAGVYLQVTCVLELLPPVQDAPRSLIDPFPVANWNSTATTTTTTTTSLTHSLTHSLPLPCAPLPPHVSPHTPNAHQNRHPRLPRTSRQHHTERPPSSNRIALA